MSHRELRYRKYFDTEHLEQNLKRSAVRGGSFTVGAQGLKFLLRILSTAILARILMPEDYGLVGMTAVVSGFVGIIRDGGLAYATIQKRSINHEETSLLFWINVGIGILISVLLVCISPLVSIVFEEPRLTSLLWVMSIPFLFGGCSVQHKALLQRQMHFGKIAIIDIASMICGITAGIAFANAQYGYWSLAIMEIVVAASTMILTWIMLPWLPSRPRRVKGMLSTWKFGGNIMFFNIINYITRSADNALIGWYWGAASLGFYTRAYSLLMMPIRTVNAPFSAVALPVLSRAANDKVKLKRYFIEGVSIVAAVVIPIVICATVFADDLVRILLGEKWLSTANLFRLLAIPALLFGASKPVSWLYIVLDRTHLLRNVGLISAPVNIIAFCIGLPYGPEGVALGYTVSSCLLYIPVLKYALKDTGIGVKEVFKTWVQPMISAGLGAGVAYSLKVLALADWGHTFTAILSITVFGAIYISVMVLKYSWKDRVMVWVSRKKASRK